MDDQYCLALNGSAKISTNENDNLTSTQATLTAIAVALLMQVLANAFGLVRKYVYHDDVCYKRFCFVAEKNEINLGKYGRILRCWRKNINGFAGHSFSGHVDLERNSVAVVSRWE